jgi:serine/threonine-protein kinase
MAPEQIKGEELSPASDIYQIGVTLYELISGRLPFEKGDMAFAHVNTEPPAIDEHVQGLSPGVAKLVHACLSKDPAERPESAEVLGESLQKLHAQITAAQIPGGAPSTDEATPSAVALDPAAGVGTPERRALLVMVLVVLIVAVVGVSWLAARQQVDEEQAPTLAFSNNEAESPDEDEPAIDERGPDDSKGRELSAETDAPYQPASLQVASAVLAAERMALRADKGGARAAQPAEPKPRPSQEPPAKAPPAKAPPAKAPPTSKQQNEAQPDVKPELESGVPQDEGGADTTESSVASELDSEPAPEIDPLPEIQLAPDVQKQPPADEPDEAEDREESAAVPEKKQPEEKQDKEKAEPKKDDAAPRAPVSF